jgi:hypothetical protein
MAASALLPWRLRAPTATDFAGVVATAEARADRLNSPTRTTREGWQKWWAGQSANLASDNCVAVNGAGRVIGSCDGGSSDRTLRDDLRQCQRASGSLGLRGALGRSPCLGAHAGQVVRQTRPSRGAGQSPDRVRRDPLPRTGCTRFWRGRCSMPRLGQVGEKRVLCRPDSGRRLVGETVKSGGGMAHRETATWPARHAQGGYRNSESPGVRGGMVLFSTGRQPPVVHAVAVLRSACPRKQSPS